MSAERHGDIRIFCLHHTDNRARKRNLLKRFPEVGLDVEWIETYHPRDRKHWDHDGLSGHSVGETSCALKHRDALRRQVRDGTEIAVLLEDDIELPDGAHAELERYIEEFREQKGDILMIGTCYDMHVDEVDPGRSVYPAIPYGRCTHAYAVALDAAKVIVPELEHMPKGIGHDLNDIVQRHSLGMFWVEPGWRQLTMSGEMLSSIGERRTWDDRRAVARRRVRRLTDALRGRA
jgi:GR25 family glycosyltransferase involved in LPS biosynthesis